MKIGPAIYLLKFVDDLNNAYALTYIHFFLFLLIQKYICYLCFVCKVKINYVNSDCYNCKFILLTITITKQFSMIYETQIALKH